MAYLDFDPADYLDEVSDRKLAKELEARGRPLPTTMADIIQSLEWAWEDDNEDRFCEALIRLTTPDKPTHAEKVRKAYADFIARRSKTEA